MRIDIVFPVLPPTLDGIGDHTARIAHEMATRCDVRILTAQQQWTPIPGVRVEKAFSVDPIWHVRHLVDAVRHDPPDWLLVQFNQFSWGRWGLNPFLPLTLHAVRRAAPATQIAWMAHEDIVPPIDVKFRIMRLWQKPQFRALGRAADAIFFSIDPWVHRYGPWFGDTPVRHFPIGSNMPHVQSDPASVRAELGLDPDAFVAGFFGTLRARLLGHVDAALHRLADRAQTAGAPSPVLLYVGPDGPALRAALPDHVVIDAGRLPADEVSRHLRVMDLHLSPFIDGVSTRRGSFMAGLQHGVPSLATAGPLTDDVLRDADGHAVSLAPIDDPHAFATRAEELYLRPDLREQIGRAGRDLYDAQFAFDVTVDAFLDALGAPRPPRHRVPSAAQAMPPPAERRPA
jgi:glycosyltransferase involved in cell wall biosynthesis